MRKTVFLLLALFPAASLSSKCNCHRATETEATRPGANMDVTIIEKKPVTLVRGTVTIVGRPMKDVLVEVFTHPEYLLSERPWEEKEKIRQERVAACITVANGEFCFRSLPAGTYELRSSISGGVDITRMHITVDPKHGMSKKIEVPMQLGT